MSDDTISPFGPSPVARGRTYLPGRVRAAGAAACCAVVLAGMTWAIFPRGTHERDPAAASGAAWNLGQALPDHPRSIAPALPSPVAVVPPPQTEVVPPAVPEPAVSHAMGFWEDANAVRQLTGQAANAASSEKSGTGTDPDVAAPRPGSDYAQRMQTTHFADVAPMPYRFHVHYTIKKGTIFPCTPAQPISSSLPGPVRCTADQDVWSMDGTTILLPRGTQVNGSVEHGLATGEERLFLVWTDALTPRPDLLAIPLDSPAADELGQTAAPGDVDDHLWKRIKTALLLSAVEFIGNAGTAALEQGPNNTYLNFNGVANTGNSLAQMAFGRDLNIPPTLYRGPGQPLAVYVNHYIDLYRFYQDRVR
jgi:type IV secretory pathway VirB10-like protein